MAKVVLIGAGGVIFAQNFIKDILTSEALKDSEIILMDIDNGRLNNAVIFANKISEKLGIDANISATTNLEKAITKADYVITMFRVGTLEHQRLEYEIPKRYGVDQVVADTIGPGGIFRGLRTLKALFEVLDVMETKCPGAYLLNYVNPMSINTIALSKRAETVKVVGLCHSVQHTANQLAGYLGADKDDLEFIVAGINHQAFFLKLELKGENAYPMLKKAIENPETYKKDKVRFELFRHFDFFPTESSGHGSEYIPYIRKRQDLIDKFCSIDDPEGYNMDVGTSGAALKFCKELQNNNEKEIAALLAGMKELDLTPSEEYAIQMISAIETNKPLSANLNVMNYGLISNLPPICCVEVPCRVDGKGIHPEVVDDYPEQLAGLNRCMVNAQVIAANGALEGDKRKIFQAIALDPLTAAVCSLDEIQAMTDELFEALGNDILQSFNIKKEVTK